MLNEGYALYKSLKECDMIGKPSFTRGHRDVTNPGKSDGLIIGLNEKGHVSRIEFRNKQEMIKLWTITKGNHNSFPAIKLQRPLWKVKSNDTLRTNLKELKKNEQEKRTLLFNQNTEFNITETEINWWQRLQERTKELQPLFKTTDKDFNVFYELMSRFQLADNFVTFLVGFLKALKDSKNDIPYSLIENILVGNKEDKNKNEYRAEVRLIFDVDDWDDADKYLNRVASPRLEPFVINCLFNMQDSSSGISTPRVSGLSGKPKILIDDKYPQLTLPIGKAYLFSATENIPCLERYGKISTEIFPVGKDEADDILRSLKGIINEDRKGKTWYPLNKDEFLIVYLESKPDISVNNAHLLGGVTKDDFSESSYEAISSVAIEALKGIKLIKANDLIRLFALRKADPGRTQVSLQRIYTVSDLEKANESWREAAKNAPNITLPFFRKEIERITAKQKNTSTIIKTFLENDKSNIINLTSHCPFPADLVRLTQKQWIRGGEDSTSVPGIALGNVYDIFFANGNTEKNMVEYLLSITLQRTQSLIIGVAQADHKKELNKFEVQKKYDSQKKFTVLKAVSAFAIFLHKLGIKKEEYMKDTFFYVGRFLSLVDTLHFEWCKHVRGGYPEKEEWRKAIPPQLLGSAHLNIALDNPNSAFDIISRRIRYYKDWTRVEQSDTVALARWAVAEIGKIATLIVEKPNYLPTSTTSTERAQILLGYLAREDKKVDTVSESLSDEGNL